jgi:predicted dehydrogenase
MKTTRRRFLHNAFATTAAALSAPRLFAAEANSAGAARIKTGFLGLAHSHAREKVRVIREDSNFEFIGAAEPNAEVRQTFEKAGVQFFSARELLDRVELVVVESAVRDHFRDAMLALQAGKHVHVEKPPAASLTDFETLVSAARAKRRQLQVGYMWRYNPGFVKALEAARNGWLGSIYLVRATMNSQVSPDRRPEWAEFKGGAMFEQGSHLIDPVVRLLGKPKAVSPFLKRHADLSDNLADNTVAVFEFDRALAIVTNATHQPNAFAHRFFEILGTNGTALLKPLEPPALQIDLANAAGPYVAGMNSVTLPAYRRYVGEFAALASAIRGESELPVNFDQELLVQETLMGACQM